jgi:hypothetical protein
MFPILAVLKRQVDEISLRGCHGQIKPVCDELLGQATRELIRGEGARCSSKHVARKLIHDNDRRKQRARTRELSSITPCNVSVQFEKALAYPLIKLITACKPQV